MPLSHNYLPFLLLRVQPMVPPHSQVTKSVTRIPVTAISSADSRAAELMNDIGDIDGEVG